MTDLRVQVRQCFERPAGRRLGLPLAILCLMLETPAAAATRSGTLLDAFLPASHYRDTQTARIHAPPWAAFAAVRAVTPDEVRGLVPLAIALHAPRFQLSPREQVMLRRPMLEALQQEDFVLLGERAGEEIVLGAIGQFWADRYVPLRSAGAFRTFRDPRFARVALNVRVRGDGAGGSLVTTEIRAMCPDPEARKEFDRYWRLWAPGGSAVRAQWLAAVRRRAGLVPLKTR